MKKNQEGSALLVVLIVTTVLFLLGSSVAYVSVHNTKNVHRQNQLIQAYYIARSGADATAAWIIEHPESAETITGLISSRTPLGNGEFEVSVQEQENGALTVVATGFVADVSRQVVLTLIPATDTETQVLLDCSLFAADSIEMQNSAQIVGTAITNAVDADNLSFSNSARITGDLVLGPGAEGLSGPFVNFVAGEIRAQTETRTYSLPEFPQFPAGLTPRGDLFVTNSSSSVITADGSYNDIKVTNSSELVVDTGNEGDTCRIVVNRLSIENSSRINLQGSGRLFIYVADDLSVKNSSTLNYDGDPDAVTLFYQGQNLLEFSNSTEVAATIFVKDADIEIKNSSGLVGNIISGGSRIEFNNSVSPVLKVVYAPVAVMEMSNSSQLRGSVICREFIAENSAAIIYDPLVQEEFTFPVTEPAELLYDRGRWQ